MRNSKSPSIYSIYQNALPFYHDRADFIHVDEKEAVFASNFLKELLQCSLSVQANATNMAADKLRHIYFESKNYEKTAGPKTFGLGFPLLIDSYEGELLVAPVFIWQMSIEPAQTKVDSWVIKFTEQGHLVANDQVVNHLKKKFDLDWEERLNALARPKEMNLKNLKGVCQELIDRLQFEEIGEIEKIAAAPGIDTIGNLTEKGTLQWSGVLGLYPPQYSSEKVDAQKPEDVFVSEAIDSGEDEFLFPFLPCDPEQQSAHELVMKNSMSVVEGVDALGKTQTVLNLLVNALVNGQNCLVVSERAQALKKTQDLLSRSGIEQFHFLLDDAVNDKVPMLELLRVMAGGTSLSTPHNEEDFQIKRKRFSKAAVLLDQSYGAVKQNIFGEKNWTDTVGLFIESQQKERKELLTSHLQASEFTFKKQEHETLKRDVQICRPSFERVGTLNHPLTALHHRFFVGGKTEDELEKVEGLLKQQLEKGKKLQHRYLNETDNYSAALRKYYLLQHTQLERQLSSLENKIKSHLEELGNDFRDAGSGGLKLGLLFSSKKKKVNKAQKETAKEYQNLIKLFQSSHPFEFEPKPDKSGLYISKMIANASSFRVGLDKWKDRIEGIIQDETNRLNSKTAHPALDVKEPITELEYSLEVYIEELNDSGLFQKLFENKTLTIPQRQKYLESILEQFESSLLNLRDFKDFHQWQTNWLGLSDLGKKLVKALIKVKPNDWVAAFESWYFHNLLSLSEKPDLPTDSKVVEDFAKSWFETKPLIVNKIVTWWKDKQSKSLKDLRRKNKTAYQRIFGKTNLKNIHKFTLKEIFDDGFEAISDMFPVLFVTPHVALNILPKGSKFDMVVFEESNRFSVELAASIASKGRRVAIFGSDDNNGNETSVLQYALESGVPSAKITNVYEAPSSVSVIPKESGQIFQFAQEYFIENLEGRFHEMEGTNDVEAQHIIRLLNQVKQTPQRVYPSVGIVAFTVEQRDLISSYLLKLKQQNSAGSEKIRQLERNGMGVYFTEELFGQQFDILILSCTFGAVNLKGELTKKLMFLNTPEGLSHLHLLINKPVQKLFIVHSLSESLLEKFRGKKYDEGTWLLANFIQLAEANRNENEALIAESLEAIGKIEKRKTQVSPFTIQVQQLLKPYLDEKRFELALPHGDIVVPFAIAAANKGQPTAAILPDLFLADTPHTSGIWEYRRWKNLTENGFANFVAPSQFWFKNHEEEARRLASKLIKLDAEFATPNKPDEIKNEEQMEVSKEDKDGNNKV